MLLKRVVVWLNVHPPNERTVFRAGSYSLICRQLGGELAKTLLFYLQCIYACIKSQWVQFIGQICDISWAGQIFINLIGSWKINYKKSKFLPDYESVIECAVGKEDVGAKSGHIILRHKFGSSQSQPISGPIGEITGPQIFRLSPICCCCC